MQGAGFTVTLILPELLFGGGSLAIFVTAMGRVPALRLLISFCFRIRSLGATLITRGTGLPDQCRRRNVPFHTNPSTAACWLPVHVLITLARIAFRTCRTITLRLELGCRFIAGTPFHSRFSSFY